MIRVFAPAKVNLYLHVVGRRDDGYHLLDSLVAFAGTGDWVEAQPQDGFSLTVDGPAAALLPPGEENIVERAARRLAGLAGRSPDAALRLTKTLPVAAGIGGGSADAAATLTALIRLWDLTLPAATVKALALELGADVPVCLDGRPALMMGVGDILLPAPALPSAWLVLVNPRIPLSTPPVFKARRGAFSSPAPLTGAPASAMQLALALQGRGNDLTAAACSLVPAITDVLSALAALPGCLLARMSGSGATCFGLFAIQAEAEDAARTLHHAAPSWWTAAAPLLPSLPNARPM